MPSLILWKLIATNILFASSVEGANRLVPEMRLVGPGKYQSFTYERPAPGKPLTSVLVKVDRFYMDAYPVTNQQFLAFVKNSPSWSGLKTFSIFADSGYLSHWTGEFTPGDKQVLGSPVSNVSWFAAQAYCKSLHKRLPSLDEWEYAARPEAYGKNRDIIQQKILEWYSRPNDLRTPGTIPFEMDCTQDGVCGLHGYLWEWVDDFGSVIGADDSRADTDLDKGLFCGAGALGGMDASNYAAFMRFAFRSSLKGTFTLSHLGFRCVK